MTTISHPAILIHPTMKLCRGLAKTKTPHCARVLGAQTHNRQPRLLRAQRKDKVILPARSRPYGSHLAQARHHAQTAQDAKDEAVQEGNGSARRHNQPYRSRQCNPRTTHAKHRQHHGRVERWQSRGGEGTYFKMAKAMASVDKVDKRCCRAPWLATGISSEPPILPVSLAGLYRRTKKRINKGLDTSKRRPRIVATDLELYPHGQTSGWPDA